MRWLILLFLSWPFVAQAQVETALLGAGFGKNGQQCYTNKANTFTNTNTFSKQIVSTIATGTAPFSVSSTTNVANLNCSSLNGSVIGTSGATIPLLNGNDTFSGSNTFNNSNTFNSGSQVRFEGTPLIVGNGQASVAANISGGGIFEGQGSTSDITLQNKNAVAICTVATGTTTLNCTGLQVGGNAVFGTAGTGLSSSTNTINSNAVYQVSYQPGLLSAVNANIGVNSKISKAATVDNIEGSAVTFTCASNPTVTMYECGTSTTCATPTTIGTVTVTAAGTVVDGTVSSSAITAGDYIGWAMTAGTCASIDIAVTAQIHSN